ncbi:MAG: gliding motility lipoprotein GldH [Bacteroidales bacterium]|nr:gliding motility lipoprotein GldH [Bacteroidales bacterium]MBK8881271.1 gliding motility lipoprotein GldH [Bacteroidales bacterium]
MIKGKNRYSFISILTSFVLLISCNNSIVYTDSMPMPGKKWELMNIPAFIVNIDDTLTSNNVTFTIRTGSSYPFRNIFLFVKTISPDGKFITDTLEYNLADEKGKWFGKGFGDIHELNLPYKSNVFFPVKGTYQFSIQHGMRIEDLNGVYDFGLRIEKTGK